ncbi:3-hydroxyacyl-CoA dehydrogenase NAD-binding domain-containing protein [Litchfieldella xinjiangensis]|uniref:3-hydroxyacyl-CoA dehydrogenase NAD-binding domain-containing protein n=1 Tax=Litchfieldella xinjiangensis TaxID=1166948 RepID=UPI000694F1A9|nr:3-hydroxyacyl-CoA dehydrogenase NAD-binding domain-containing protein [Halomonas xinjiangensis]
MSIDHIAVIGAGIMGQGIAQISAQQGVITTLYDVQPGAAAAARERVAEALKRRIDKGRMSDAEAQETLSRVRLAETFEALGDADLVVEAIVEDLAVKRDLFRRLEAICGAHALLCSNTSSLSIGAIAEGLTAPQRVAGLHFFNPAPAMRLVEVVSAPDTSEATRDALLEFARTLGKTPVAVNDSPGFIVNRCARPFYGEALHLLEQGTADAETLDACLTCGGGFPLGPFALIDLVGVDINLKATTTLWEAFGRHPRFRPSPLIEAKVAAGELGKKSGQGFYRHDRETPPSTALPPAQVDSLDVLLAQLPLRLPGLSQVSDGHTAAALSRRHAQPVTLFDVSLVPWPKERAMTLAFASHGLSEAEHVELIEAAATLGVRLVEVPDRPGLVVLRVATMLIGEARRALAEGVATADAMDTAMRLGLNFALGPWDMLERLGSEPVETTLAGAASEDDRGRYLD